MRSKVSNGIVRLPLTPLPAARRCCYEAGDAERDSGIGQSPSHVGAGALSPLNYNFLMMLLGVRWVLSRNGRRSDLQKWLDT